MQSRGFSGYNINMVFLYVIYEELTNTDMVSAVPMTMYLDFSEWVDVSQRVGVIDIEPKRRDVSYKSTGVDLMVHIRLLIRNYIPFTMQ